MYRRVHPFYRANEDGEELALSPPKRQRVVDGSSRNTEAQMDADELHRSKGRLEICYKYTEAWNLFEVSGNVGNIAYELFQIAGVDIFFLVA